MTSKQKTPLHRFAAYGMSAWVGIFVPVVQAASPLPVPCAGGACGINPNPTPWIGQGSGSVSVTPDGSHMVIQQTTDKAIFNWAGFNIGAGNSVQFAQPNAAASALNRIWDANPSTIQGQLSANGQIFLLNQNGILFAPGAQVDTRSLVASSLDINDNVYLNGLIANLSSNPQFSPFSGATAAGFVRVEAGATITTGSGGSVMLFAPTVENNGVIHTPDGQILLAAGSKIYLAPSGDANLRGLLVAVDNPGTSAAAPGTSTVSNLDLGKLIAERGNVTMAGLAVNQKGRVTATTSVSANGTVYLMAGDTAQFNSSLSNPYPVTRGGTLTLGATSVTEVLPDNDDSQTIADSANMNVSKVIALAHNIVLQGDAATGALIRVPGGDVTLSARELNTTSTGTGDYTSTALSDNLKSYPNPPANTAARANTRIEMQGGSRIDVSGMSNVELAMERNLLQIQLRGDELKDAPLQRDGFLRGKTVEVDLRSLDENGRIPLADLSGYKNQIARTVKERLAAGGTVKLQSEGDVVIKPGASIDVSGGSVRYRDGYVYTSQLVSQNGKIYDISEAPADETYVGFANEKLISGDKWLEDQSIKTPGKFEPGYVEGKDAGTVQIVAHNLSLPAGVLRGTATVGPYQRDAAHRPLGGQLILGDASYQVALDGQKEYDFKLPGITFYSGSTAGTDGNVWISTDLFDAGFDRLAVYSNGAITVPVDTTLATRSGGNVTLGSTQRIDVQGNILTPGGAITLKTFQPFGGLDGDVTLGVHTLISAAGTWTNDYLPNADRAAAIQADAGSITIEGYGDLDLATGSVLDVNGGAWMKQDATVSHGDAGSISLSIKSLDPSQNALNRILLNSELRGYALGKGGSLKIRAAKALIADTGTPLPDGWGAETLALDPSFFTRGGFSNFSIEGYDALTVAANTVIRPDYASWQLKNPALAQPTGSPMSDLAKPVVLPWQLRAPMGLSLKSGNNFSNSGGVQFGQLKVGTGAVIDVGPQGSINLGAGNLLTVDGSLAAAAGSIALDLAQVGDWYRDNRAIWLGSHARLDASGVAKLLPGNTGLRQGEVLQGGTITLSAGTGTLDGKNYAGAGNVVIQARADGQATLDVSGAKATLDLAAQQGNATIIQATEVASDAGSVVMTATEGIFLDDGVMKGKAGGAGAAGGRFAAAIWKDKNASTPGRGYPTLYGDRQMILAQTGNFVPTGLTPGAPIDSAAYGGKAYIPVGGLISGGFDSVAFKSENRIAFSGPVELGVQRQIVLDAPTLAGGTGDVNLRAAYVRAGNLDPLFQANIPAPSGGTSHLDVEASTLDLEGNFALQGFQSAEFNADEDIRFNAVAVSGSPTYTGSLSAAGNLVFKSAQAYPTTLSVFKVSTSGDVSFTGNNHAAPLPLSAGGHLSVNAANIFQNGVLRAPLGSLTLTASNTIQLGDGSLTSVSAAGALLPFGQTSSDGSEWIYQLDNYTLILDAPPEKAIRLDAPEIEVKALADLDLSAGGDLYAYEFLPGPGGSRDILAEPGVYAVIPGYVAGYAPRDLQNIDATLQAGASVYLSGGGGLSAGVYTLLPAHYALMPGAYLVKSVSGYQDMLPRQNRALADGAALVAGRALVSGTDIAASRSQGYLVESGEVVRKYSSFIESHANPFFTQAAENAGSARSRLPEDAGLLSLRASQLAMNAAPRFDAITGGRGGMLDIASSAIAITDDATGAPSGYLGLSVDMLNSFNVESLLIGGTRSVSASGYDIGVTATDVRLQNTAGHVLKAGEVMLASRDQLTLGSGTDDGRDGYVESQGTLTGAPGEITLNGDGAFLRVAQSSLPILSRGATSGAAGTLTLHDGARLTGGSILLDATRDNLIAGTAVFNSDAVSLASSRISFGDVPAGQDGLKVTPGLLAQLRQARDLRLRTYSSMDFYDGASVDLTDGATAPAGLTLDAPALLVHTDEDVVFRAHSLALGNTSGPYSGSATPVAGSLSLQAVRYTDGEGHAASGTGRITLGDGQVEFQGGRAYTLAASDAIVASGTGGVKAVGALTLETPRLVADTGAVHDIQSNAALNVVRSATANLAAQADTLGGRLDLKGDTVYVNSQIDALAGHVGIEATGGAAGADNLILADGARVNAAGYAKAFGTETAYAAGGHVTLSAVTGNVSVNNGARVSVAGAGEGDAGSLAIQAVKGTVKLAGDLDGSADTAQGALGGSLSLDLAGLDDFSALLSKLKTGKFAESVNVRLRGPGAAGSIAMATGDTLASHDVLLVSDQGTIHLAGTIDSTGTRGGSIQAYAAGDVVLQPAARLNASATDSNDQFAGTRGDGGKVTLATTGGTIDIQSGSTIDVSAHGSYAEGGKVVLRAPRNSAGTDLAIAHLDGAIVGADDVMAEGFKTYARTSLSTGDVAVGSALYNDANTFMGNAATIAARLGKGSDGAFHVRPGVEVDSGGDLTLSGDWGLQAWHVAGEPGVLTLRAADNLILNGSISDGFNSTAPSASQNGGSSWSYRLVSGADSGSSNPLAMREKADLAGKGHFTLAASKMVRTGTGDIDIAVGGDLTLKSSSANQVAVIYTAGVPGDTTGYTIPFGTPKAVFPDMGGDLSIRVGGDVKAEVSGSSYKNQQQLITDWLARKVNVGSAFWWPDFSSFRQGVGALGGGNVRIAAGGDIVNLGAVVPVSGKTNTASGATDVRGGGDLSVIAGGDIRGGVFQVGSGQGRIQSGGSIREGRTVSGVPIYPYLALEQGGYNVSALGNVTIASVFDPTALYRTGFSGTPYFYDYAPGSKVGVQSLIGDVRFDNNNSNLTLLKNAFYPTFTAGGVTALSGYPGQVAAASLSGGIAIANSMVLFPDAQGNLKLLAEKGVTLEQGSEVYLSDYDPLQIPGALNASTSTVGLDQYQQFSASISRHATPLLHGSDSASAYVYAAQGDVDLAGYFVSTRQTTVDAGRDIVFRSVAYVQNNAADNLSSFRAGRDIVSPSVRNVTNGLASNNAELQVGGPGYSAFFAGRHIDLGNSSGISSYGNLKNQALPAGGATLSVAAGLGQDGNGHARDPDYAGFAASYLAPGSLALADFKAPAGFSGLPLAQQVVLVFNNELLIGSTEGQGGKGYSRAYDAIAALFPSQDANGVPLAYQGDVDLVFSRISTQQTGDINLLMPGGRLNVGLANPPPSLADNKLPSDLGIMTFAGGNILAMAQGDIQVNQSRVLTVAGGDILLWSTLGNVDAGKGKKTATAAPPPQVTYDASGNPTLNVQGTVSGSGIGTLKTNPNIPDGNVVLAAPSGVVDAGDAGIRSSGNLLIAAQQVLNAGNIQVGGLAVGAPVSSSGLGAGLSGLGNLSPTGQSAEDATRSVRDNTESSAEQMRKVQEAMANFKPALISVEVLGFGSEADDCKNNDGACRKQKNSGS